MNTARASVELLEARIAPAVAISPVSVLPAGLEAGHAVDFYKANDYVETLESAVDLVTNRSRQLFTGHDDGVPMINYADFADPLVHPDAFAGDRDFKASGTPFDPLGADHFVMRAEGFLFLPEAGTWEFTVTSDNGFRLRMGAEGAVVAEWDQVSTFPAEVSVAAAGYYPYELVYYEAGFDAYVELSATGPGQAGERLVGDPAGRIQVFHAEDGLVQPLAGRLQGELPGHAVRFYKARPDFALASLDLALSLIRIAAAQDFTLDDIGGAAINYIDAGFGDSANFPGDRDLNDIPGSLFLGSGNNDDHFAMRAHGFLYIPQAGEWRFTVNSDDGFRLRVGGWEVASVTGVKGVSDVNGVFSAAAPGFYPYELVYFDGMGDASVELSARGPGQTANVLVGDVPHGGLAVFQSTVAATPNPAEVKLGTLTGRDGFTIFGTEADQSLGDRVAGVGDLNGDGISDFVVTDYLAAPGASYVFFGKAGGFPAGLTPAQLDGANGFRVNAGYTVGRHAGDFDGDGFDDFLVSDGTSAYLIRGHAGGFPANLDLATLDGGSGFKIIGVDIRGSNVRELGGAGDVNGDGYADLLLGAPRNDEAGQTESGAAYVLFGRPGAFSASFDITTVDGSTGFKLHGVSDDERLGNVVAALGDINGDGYGDIALHGKLAGGALDAIFVVYGHAGNFATDLAADAVDGTTGFIIPETGGADGLARVGAAGDVNGDGLADILLGASSTDAPTDAEGAAYVIFGSTTPFPASFDLGTLTGTNGFRVTGAATEDTLGREVDGAGDVNGDGFADLLLGAPTFGATAGAAWVIFGKAGSFDPSFSLAGLDPTKGFKLTGVGIDDSTGRTVSAAGDVNGDGFADVIIGAVDNDAGGSTAGAAYVVFGHATEKALTVSTARTTAPFQIAKDLKSAVFTDVDGDLVTVKITKGTLSPDDFILHASGLGARLALLDLSGEADFAKTNVTVTAKPQKIGGVLRGDGRADVGFLDASGLALGVVTVPGTLGGIEAGDGFNGLIALTVGALGRAPGAGLPLVESSIFGSVKTLTVRGDVSAAHVLAGSFGKVTIGGSLRADGVDGAGFESASTIGSFTVKGGILGDAAHRVEITADGFARPTAKNVVALKTLTITGNLEHARIAVGGRFHPDAQIGAVTVGGNWLGSDLVAGALAGAGDRFGDANDTRLDTRSSSVSDVLAAKIASVTIKGLVLATPNASDRYGIVAEEIGAFKLGAYKAPLRPGATLDDFTFGDLRLRELPRFA